MTDEPLVLSPMQQRYLLYQLPDALYAVSADTWRPDLSHDDIRRLAAFTSEVPFPHFRLIRQPIAVTLPLGQVA